jgi:predicted transcriptional regulator
MTPNPVPSREAMEDIRRFLERRHADEYSMMLRDLLAEVERLTKNINDHIQRMHGICNERDALRATVAAQAAALAEIESWRSDAATSRHWSRGEAVDQLTEILERAALASQRSVPRGADVSASWDC